MFSLNEKLENDTIHLTDLALCRVLMMNDQTYPWIILVPRKSDITEIHHLCSEDQLLLMKEISFISTLMEKQFKPDSLNVAALGNVVSQLHIHIIARYHIDKTWPGPVWGQHEAHPYQDIQREKMLRSALKDLQSL